MAFKDHRHRLYVLVMLSSYGLYKLTSVLVIMNEISHSVPEATQVPKKVLLNPES